MQPVSAPGNTHKEEGTMPRRISIASIAFALIGLVLMPPRQAQSGTELDAFESRVGKSAAKSFDTRKVLCVCKDGSQHNNSVGYLRQFHEPSGPGGQIEVTLTCEVVVFVESTGEHVAQTTCSPWELLPK